MKILHCVLFYAVLGIVFFGIGRLLAKLSFSYEKFPFKCYDFENEGLIYKKLGVHRWQNRVPDMSRLCRNIMPAKKFSSRPDKKTVCIMINETCVAELIHMLLCIFGLGVLWIWPGWGGAAVWIIYVLCNLPDVVIQRYNRPRLIKLMAVCRDD